MSLFNDTHDLDDLMNALFFKLIFFIDSYVHDVHTAEDIAIDLFADLVIHPHRYNGKSSIKTYLFMRARCRAIDHLRHRKTLSLVELNEAVDLSDSGKSLEEYMLTDERKRAVHTALTQLPEDMRTAVHLIYFEDMTYDEAARVMKKNRKQVDNLLYRAKTKLRELLREEGEWLL